MLHFTYQLFQLRILTVECFTHATVFSFSIYVEGAQKFGDYVLLNFERQRLETWYVFHESTET